MRAIVVLIAVSGCYSPRVDVCTIHCGTNDVACPLDMTCGADHYCHDPASTDTCSTSEVMVTVRKSGNGVGTVTGTGGIACGSTCNTIVASATDITLLAAAESGSRFAGWTGPCTGTDPCRFSSGQDVEIGAVFNVSVDLAITFLGAGGGTVASTPIGVNCTADCSAPFDQNTSVTLSAVRTSGSVFVEWGGDCTGLQCTTLLDMPRAVTARFE